jgi:hypothetical protein
MDMGNPDNRRFHETKGWTPNLVRKYGRLVNKEQKMGISLKKFPEEGPLIQYKQLVSVFRSFYLQVYSTAGSSLKNHWFSIRLIIVA